jgi:septum formation protein
MGVEHGVLEVDVVEQRQPGEPPRTTSAASRARRPAPAAQVMASPGAMVLGADTEVVLGDKVYGKPAMPPMPPPCCASWRAPAPRADRGVAVDAGREQHLLSETAVDSARFRRPTSPATWTAGKWRGKAGAYGIQGRAGAFVARIEGSYSGVMGLPVHETWMLLRQFAAI